jgi:1-deoxy-D-xylulose-5-phosphate reductoisomerase
MRRIAILGATGSIGRAAVEVAERFPDRLRIVGLSARRLTPNLVSLIHQTRVSALALTEAPVSSSLREQLPPDVELYTGSNGLAELAAREDLDLVLVAVVGLAGLAPTLVALKKGKTVALATKEALVAGGNLVLQAAREGKGTLLPVDSEHSAIFQCLEGHPRSIVRRILLTASGGPFRDTSPAQMVSASVEQALAHPVWKMGSKITVDSATLMNKALEIIEAHFLFQVTPEQIEVIIHPQSIVHSLVEFCDGAMLAQLSLPDMRLPIQYALLYPERLPSLVPPLELAAIGSLTFQTPDTDQFPALSLAHQVLRSEGTLPTVLSAADEVAVKLFLEGKLPFLRIVPLVRQVVEQHASRCVMSIDEIVQANRWARQETLRLAGLAEEE